MSFYLSDKSMVELIKEFEQKFSNLENELKNLEEKMKMMCEQFQSQQVFEPSETDSLADVHNIQVGDALITEKTGFISVEKNLQLGGEQFYIAKKLPYSIIKVQTPLNLEEKT